MSPLLNRHRHARRPQRYGRTLQRHVRDQVLQGARPSLQRHLVGVQVGARTRVAIENVVAGGLLRRQVRFAWTGRRDVALHLQDPRGLCRRLGWMSPCQTRRAGGHQLEKVGVFVAKERAPAAMAGAINRARIAGMTSP